MIWQIFSSSGLTRLPGPTTLWTDDRTRELLLYPFYDMGGLDKGLFWQTLASLGRVAKGYTAAAVVGISVGVLVGGNQLLNKALDPLFQFLRMVAPLAWVPIALVALQQNQPAAIFVIFITSVWPILINTAEGVRQIPDDYQNVAKVLQLSRKDYYLNIVFPAALPYIFTGLEDCDWPGLAGDYCRRDCDVGDCWDWLFYLGCVSAELHQRDYFGGDLYRGGGSAARSSDRFHSAPDCHLSKQQFL